MTMHAWKRSRALLVATVLMVACGDDGRASDASGDTVPGIDGGPIATDGGPGAPLDAMSGPVDGGTPPVGSSTSAPPEAIDRMVGSFALEATFGTISMVPFLGDQAALGRSWGLVDIVQEGDTLVMTERGCRVASEGSMATIPDAVPQSIAPRVATLEFLEGASGIRWVRPELATAVGWTPASDTDTLPQTADDPRVIDQDGDGQPGVTVSVSGIASGDVYVVQWQRGWYEGDLGTSGEIVGENHGDGGEQKTIGASSMLLEQDVPQRANPDTSMNVVRLVSIEAGYDCARLIAEAGSLF